MFIALGAVLNFEILFAIAYYDAKIYKSKLSDPYTHTSLDEYVCVCVFFFKSNLQFNSFCAYTRIEIYNTLTYNNPLLVPTHTRVVYKYKFV